MIRAVIDTNVVVSALIYLPPETKLYYSLR